MYLCRSKEEEDSDAGEAAGKKEEEKEEAAASQHDLASWQLSCGMLQPTDRQRDRRTDSGADRRIEENPLVNHLLNLVAQTPNLTEPIRTVAGANLPDKATLWCGSRFARFCGYFEISMEFIFLNSFFFV